MKDVYITGGLRTPIGLHRGKLKKQRPEQLGAAVLNELKRRCHLEHVDEVICGNAVGTGGNIGRLMTLMSDLPVSTPACTLDMQCASAGEAVALGMAKIRSGMADTLIAGGIESASLQPSRVYAEDDDRQGEYLVAQFSPDELDPLAMLKGAQRVADKYHMKKEELDRWSLRSHELAARAALDGSLKNLILPLPELAGDEGIRPRLSQRVLDRMPLVLGPGTLIHGGNACFTHDGAAFVVLTAGTECATEAGTATKAGTNADAGIAARTMAGAKAGANTDTEIAAGTAFRLVDARPWAGEPLYSPEGALEATKQILNRNNLTMADLDAVEWNEAFAVIDVLFERNWPDQLAKYNRFGGALAYGHPFGCSGAIILLHLMQSLETAGGRLGVCAIAGAGGTGTAILVERIPTKII